VLPTIASRCQAVRFDPLPEVRIEERLRGEAARMEDEEHSEEEERRLAACARLGLGDARRASELAGRS